MVKLVYVEGIATLLVTTSELLEFEEDACDDPSTPPAEDTVTVLVAMVSVLKVVTVVVLVLEPTPYVSELGTPPCQFGLPPFQDGGPPCQPCQSPCAITNGTSASRSRPGPRMTALFWHSTISAVALLIGATATAAATAEASANAGMAKLSSVRIPGLSTGESFLDARGKSRNF